MSGEGGYIKLYRSLTDWEWYDDANTMRVWIHLLLKANHEDGRWHGIEIKRGQRFTSYPKLAAELSLTVRQVRTAIEHLKNGGEIVTQKADQGLLITVEKYAFFQGQKTGSDTRTTRETADERQTSDTRTTTNKNNKNNKKDKNYNAPRKRGRNSFEDELDVIIEGSEDE